MTNVYGAAQGDNIKNDPVEPEGSKVFDLTNGEKVRLTFDTVASYISKGSAETVVKYGWGDSLQTYILDIDFDTFDRVLQQYKLDMKNYYNLRYGY